MCFKVLLNVMIIVKEDRGDKSWTKLLIILIKLYIQCFDTQSVVNCSNAVLGTL